MTIAIDQTIGIIALVAVDTGRMIDIDRMIGMVVCFHQRVVFRPDTRHHVIHQWIIALAVIWAADIIRKIGIQTQDPIDIPNPMADIIQRL